MPCMHDAFAAVGRDGWAISVSYLIFSSRIRCEGDGSTPGCDDSLFLSSPCHHTWERLNQQHFSGGGGDREGGSCWGLSNHLLPAF